MTWFKTAALAAVVAGGVAVTPVAAGSYQGDFLVRLQGTVVAPDASADVFVGGVPPAVPGASADVSTEVIPTLTLTYFLNKNIAAELFCCFAKFDVEGKGTAINNNDLGDTWVFPPIVTLQYHFDSMNGFKPYVGAGVQYIAFFSEGKSNGGFLGTTQMDIDNAFGFALQAGFDLEIGQGWYLNADVKKVWLDTEASWKDAAGATVATADVDIDPWIFSVGVGYRFNLSDIFGSRQAAAPLK